MAGVTVLAAGVQATTSPNITTPVATTATTRVVSYPAAFFAPAQPLTAFEMLQRTPGFVFDAGTNARGFVGAAGNVLLDGSRPASKDDTLEDLLRRIPASSVLRIDVILGGALGIDMQGKSILADVVRQPDRGRKLTVNLSASHGFDKQIAGNLLVEGEERVGDTTYEGSLRIARLLDGNVGGGTWARTFGAGGGFNADELTRGTQELYKATGAVETPVPGGTIRVNAAMSVSPSRENQDDTLVSATGQETDRATRELDRGEVGARYKVVLSSNFSLESFLLQRLGRETDGDNFLSDPQTAAVTQDQVSAYFNLRKITGESIARANLTWQIQPTLAIEFGGEGDYNWLSSHTIYYQNMVLTPLPAADVKVDELRGETFATATWQALPTLTIEAGLRVEASHIASTGDVVSARSLLYPKPRLALAWSPEPADQLRIRIEREVGQLDFDDFTAQAAGLNSGAVYAGNPTLNPGEDWVATVTWDRRFWGGGDVTLGLRHLWLTDVVDRIGVSSPTGVYDAPGNIGNGHEDTATLTVALPLDRLAIPNGRITGMATLRRSNVIDPTTDLSRGLSGLHDSDWELHYSQGLPKLNASFGVDVVGPSIQTFYRFNEVDTDKQTISASAYAEYSPRPDMTLRLEMLNLLGQRLEHSREVYEGPRNVYGLDYGDVRQIRAPHFIRVRIIKTFQ